jgi:hypothetical protein
MAVKAVFNGGGLLAGLGSTSNKLKEVQHHSKSTTTEMKRMKGGANKLKGALAAIGVGGFAALLMTTPQLAGSLAKIKYEMQRLAWSVGKHLKPSLDAVATILQGIRTGDWSTIIQGVKDLTNSVIDLIKNAGTFVIDLVFGEGTFDGLLKGFTDWIDRMWTAWQEGDLLGLISAMMEPVKWLQDIFVDIGEFLFNMGKNAIDNFIAGFKSAPLTTLYDTIKSFLPAGIKPLIGFGERVLEREVLGTRQLGGYIPQTGLYQLHAGESVTMKGSSGMNGSNGSSNITLDFSGANINLAGGIELNDFADSISKKIAEKQQSLTY